jgi:hypothetical protein
MATTRQLSRALLLGVALTLLATACSRSDEDTTGGATAGVPSPTGSSTTGNTGSTTGASGVSGSLGDTGATGASGASGESGATATAVTITAVEYRFRFDEAVPSGDAGFILTNEGDEPHELQVLELTDGKTIEDLEALVEAGLPNRPPSWVEPVAGTFAKPGETSRPAKGQLEGGRSYVFACFVPNERGVPHAALGMLAEVGVA